MLGQILSQDVEIHAIYTKWVIHNILKSFEDTFAYTLEDEPMEVETPDFNTHHSVGLKSKFHQIDDAAKREQLKPFFYPWQDAHGNY